MAGGSGVPLVLDGETLRLVNEEQGYRYRERQRYLQEDDRITIIRRIDEGQRQSELAREFGVTRAAICNTYKHREEILARSRHVYDAQCAAAAEQVGGDVDGRGRRDKLAMKKRRRSVATSQDEEVETKEKAESDVEAPWSEPLLHEDSPSWQQHYVEPARRPTNREPAREPLVSFSAERVSRFLQLLTTPVVRLMCQLRDRETSIADFRERAGQLIRLLIKESLVITSTSPSRNAPSNVVVVGPGDGGYPLLRSYQELFPDKAVGIFRFQQDKGRTRFVDASLPSGIGSATSVMLVTSECATGQVVCCAVKELVALGIPESAIFLVVVFASKPGLARVEQQFPAVRGLVAAIDSQVDAMGRIQPGCGGFLDRYYDVDLLGDDGPVSS